MVPKLEKDNIQESIDETHCYEYIEPSLEYARRQLRFWIDGVMIFVIGCLGFIGNLITIIVLWEQKRNRNFHVLIIWCVIWILLLM